MYPSGGLQPTGWQRFDSRHGDAKHGRYDEQCEFLRFCMADNVSYPPPCTQRLCEWWSSRIHLRLSDTRFYGVMVMHGGSSCFRFLCCGRDTWFMTLTGAHVKGAVESVCM